MGNHLSGLFVIITPQLGHFTGGYLYKTFAYIY